MSKVFICHSHNDIYFVRKLSKHLEEAGFKVLWDKNLAEGDVWTHNTKVAIEESDYCIVVLSPDSLESEWVAREYTYAISKRIKIIPILFKTCDLPMALVNIQYIDFRGDNFKLGLQNLLSEFNVSKFSTINPLPARPSLKRKLLSALRDPMWQMIGVIVAVILFVLGFYIQRNPHSVTSTAPIEGELVVDQNFEKGESSEFIPHIGYWKVVDDGTGKNMVLESKNADNNIWAYIEFGPVILSDMIVEFHVKLIAVNPSSYESGKVILQWRTGDSYYALDIAQQYRCLYYQDDINRETVKLGQYDLFREQNIWYSIRLEVRGDLMKVYMDNNLEIMASYTRPVSAGRLVFTVDANAQIQFDDVKVWVLDK